MTALDVLRGARELLDGGKGWVKGSYVQTPGTGKKRYCSLGAVNMATFKSPYKSVFCDVPEEIKVDRSEALIALSEAMGRPVSKSDFIFDSSAENNVIHWNDLGSRTASEVLAAFDRAIEELSNE